jgi:hypothetical protein
MKPDSSGHFISLFLFSLVRAPSYISVNGMVCASSSTAGRRAALGASRALFDIGSGAVGRHAVGRLVYTKAVGSPAEGACLQKE